MRKLTIFILSGILLIAPLLVLSACTSNIVTTTAYSVNNTRDKQDNIAASNNTNAQETVMSTPINSVKTISVNYASLDNECQVQSVDIEQTGKDVKMTYKVTNNTSSNLNLMIIKLVLLDAEENEIGRGTSPGKTVMMGNGSFTRFECEVKLDTEAVVEDVKVWITMGTVS